MSVKRYAEAILTAQPGHPQADAQNHRMHSSNQASPTPDEHSHVHGEKACRKEKRRKVSEEKKTMQIF